MSAGGSQPAERLDALEPLERHGPLRVRVHDRLRELIINRSLAPGHHLVELELADRLDVSRGPVREALQSLHAEGWVDLRPGRGAFVHDPTDQEVNEIFLVRAALESEAARLAAPQINEPVLRELRSICGRGRSAVRAWDEAGVVDANSQFHRRVAATSGVSLLCTHINRLDLRVRWFFRPVVRTRGMDSWDEHEELIARLEQSDAEGAGQLMHAHSERTRQAYLQLSAEESERPVRRPAPGRRS